jgi:putative SOS response-associated peptidase YedK
MCFNAALTKKQRDLAAGLGIPEEEFPPFNLFYNVSGFSHPELPLLFNDCGLVKAAVGVWGLIPFWVRDEKKADTIRNQTLNARAETIRTLPSFRHLVNTCRCLVVVDGFYEPHHLNGQTWPFFCRLPDGEPMTLAGLYSDWNDRRTFTIITVPAVGLMAEVHNDKLRMPRIIKSEERGPWLDPSLTGERIPFFLMDNSEESRLEAWPVSKALYKRGPEAVAPGIQEPVYYPELQRANATGKSENREV